MVFAAWVVSLKDKKGINITNALHKFLDETGSKPKKIWVDRGTDIYNRSMKSLKIFIQHTMKKNLLLLKYLLTL